MQEETFKVKKSENSNFLYVLDVDSKEDKGAEILTQTTQVIELQKSKPKIYQVLTLLRLNTNLKRADLLNQTQISPGELQTILSTLNYKHLLRIFEASDGCLSLMSQEQLFDIMGDLLVFLNSYLTDQSRISVQEVLDKNGGCIRTQFGEAEVRFGLAHLGVEENPGVFQLKLAMVKRILAYQALSEKSDGFILHEFVTALRTVFDLGIPAPLESQAQETDS
mmetsp:Transcript_35715/g.54656  ORF Transcript_35715/g.54656 Transcript_35715/m.54656 type:complete len:222 (-) Transcript_35715:226-891(-)